MCGLLVMTGAGLRLSENDRVGPNRPTFEGGLIDANNSPTVVGNPRRPGNLVVVHRVDRPRFSARLEHSTDSGGTWAQSDLPLPPGLDRPYAPDAAFGPDGSLYVVYANLEGPGNVPANLWMVTSPDGGRTLTGPFRVAGRLAFQPRVTVAPDGRVHVVWLQAGEVGQLRLGPPPNPVVTASSTDGGRSFSAPVEVSGARPRVGAAVPAVDGRGRLLVLYQDFGDDRRDFENIEGPPWDEPSTLVVTRSDDGGRTFGEDVIVDSEVSLASRFLPFSPEFPGLATGGGDDVFVTWSDSRHGDPDVFMRRSSDGGAKWSRPVKVNRNRISDGTAQYLPRVAVAPDGRVDVVFLDRSRDRRNVMTDVSLASSSDRGRSFDSVRVSSASFSSLVGPRAGPLLPVDLGNRLGLSAREHSVAVWTDTRLGTTDTERQDIVVARIETAKRRFVLATVAAMTALVTAGVLALGGAAVLRRRGQDSD